MTDKEKFEWRSSLKFGDTICLVSGYFGDNTHSIAHVVKITKTMVVVGSNGYEHRFYIKNGYEVGVNSLGSYWATIVPLTDVEFGKMKREKLVKDLKNKLNKMNSFVKFDILSNDEIELVCLKLDEVCATLNKGE